jgi:hypothetical protein
LANGPRPGPTDLVEEGVWNGIMRLPDDVAITTSNHHGSQLAGLYLLWGNFIEAIGDEQDELFFGMLDAADCFQASAFESLHGYYRSAYSHAIADDQHADHQLRVDRGATGVAVVRLQRLTDGIEVKMPVDASQHVIGRDMLIEAEIIKQLGRRLLSAHHCRVPPAKSPEAVNHGSAAASINGRVFQRYRRNSALIDNIMDFRLSG